MKTESLEWLNENRNNLINKICRMNSKKIAEIYFYNPSIKIPSPFLSEIKKIFHYDLDGTQIYWNGNIFFKYEQNKEVKIFKEDIAFIISTSICIEDLIQKEINKKI